MSDPIDDGVSPERLDPFFRARHQAKLGEVRGSIRELEAITRPLRHALDCAETRLSILRQTEADLMEALRD